jgi:hypothetical protein
VTFAVLKKAWPGLPFFGQTKRTKVGSYRDLMTVEVGRGCGDLVADGGRLLDTTSSY